MSVPSMCVTASMRGLVLFFSSRRRHTRFDCDWSSDVCSSDLSYVIDSGAWNGQVNLSWPARLTNGDPVPAGDYTVGVEGRLGQNAVFPSQPIPVSHRSVDTPPSPPSLPRYEYLPQTEGPPPSWGPVGGAF